jgi:hypothetical protein
MPNRSNLENGQINASDAWLFESATHSAEKEVYILPSKGNKSRKRLLCEHLV